MSIFSTIARAAGGFLTGGPLGAAAAVFAPSIIGKARGSVFGNALGGPGLGISNYPVGGSTGEGGTMCPTGTSCRGELSAGGFCLGSCVPYGTNGMGVTAMGGACPTGYRLNKSTYVTRGGGTSRWGPSGSLVIHPKRSTCVRRRRRNVGNAKALRRAISRVKGFVKLAHKAHALVGSHRGRSRKAIPATVEVVRTG